MDSSEDDVEAAVNTSFKNKRADSQAVSAMLGDESGAQLSMAYGLTNSLVSFLLFLIALLCMFLIFSDPNTADLFSCAAVSGDATRDSLNCVFKYACFFMSFLLLLPYLLESVLVSELFIGGRAKPEKVYGILEKTHNSSARETIVFGAKNFLYLIYAVVASFLLLPLIPFSKQIQDSWKAIPYVVPKLLLNITLFPLSFVVIFSSQSIAETFVNLVAVQIFAGLSDVFVAQVFRPEQAISSTLSLYFPSVNFNKGMSKRNL